MTNLKTTKASLYHSQRYQNCLTRINNITASSKAAWGKMDAAQMFAHCSEVLEVMNGKPLKVDFMSRLLKPIIRRTVLGDKPYGKAAPTAPQFEIKASKDFVTEKARLLAALDEFYTMDKTRAVQIKHGFFGTLSLEERGWSMFKHLDHHLNQFGQTELASSGPVLSSRLT